MIQIICFCRIPPIQASHGSVGQTTSQHAIDFQTKGMFLSYPRSVCLFPKVDTELISSSNTRTSQQHGLSSVLLTSTIKLVIFLGPKKSYTLVKLKRHCKQCIIPLILQLNELANLTWHGTASVGLFFLRQVYFLYKLY